MKEKRKVHEDKCLWGENVGDCLGCNKDYRDFLRTAATRPIKGKLCKVEGIGWALIQKLQFQKYTLLGLLQRVYRKHHMGDESIGWEELSNEILDVLGTVMGDEECVNWQEFELERIGRLEK